MIGEYINAYFQEIEEIISKIDRKEIEYGIQMLRELRTHKGRLFILGVGGSAANASHAVNDFRKIGKIETYAPTDNVSELTARTNDEGWETTFEQWLLTSNLCEKDAILIFSVGGGSKNTSLNIVNAINLAMDRNSKIISIVSRNGGYAKEKSHVCVHIPVLTDERITPHAEEWQGIIWHLMVNAL